LLDGQAMKASKLHGASLVALSMVAFGGVALAHRSSSKQRAMTALQATSRGLSKPQQQVTIDRNAGVGLVLSRQRNASQDDKAPRGTLRTFTMTSSGTPEARSTISTQRDGRTFVERTASGSQRVWKVDGLRGVPGPGRWFSVVMSRGRAQGFGSLAAQHQYNSDTGELRVAMFGTLRNPDVHKLATGLSGPELIQEVRRIRSLPQYAWMSRD
jgi:hypothetical protein